MSDAPAAPCERRPHQWAGFLGRWLRRPLVQDLGLVLLLAAGTLTWNGATNIDQAGSGAIVGDTAAAVPLSWAGTVLCLAAVLFRRRWPVPALAVALLGSFTQMALTAGPTFADLAAPIVLHTMATQGRRRSALIALAVALLGSFAWILYVGLDGKADGWATRQIVVRADSMEAASPPGAGPSGVPEPRPTARPTPPRPVRPTPLRAPPPPPTPGRLELLAAKGIGPTDWGGIPLIGALVAGWGVGSSVRNRRSFLDELRARARDLERERDQQAALAAAAERGRITRELHDVVAHGLAVIVMQAQGGAAMLDRRPEETRDALDTIVATGRASLTEMRQVLAATGGDASTHPVPGLGMLPRLVDQVRDAGAAVLLHIEGDPVPLPTTIDVAAYRIVQEALTNVLKHAGPGASAQVSLSYEEATLTVQIADNGAGEPGSGSGSRSGDGTGNGLRGMRERVDVLGGEFSAGPVSPGPVHRGFVVRARFPFESERSA